MGHDTAQAEISVARGSPISIAAGRLRSGRLHTAWSPPQGWPGPSRIRAANRQKKLENPGGLFRETPLNPCQVPGGTRRHIRTLKP